MPDIATEVMGPTPASRARAIKDIRSLTAEKQPRSANEMVAVVAYYLSELAAEDEASKTVNTAAVANTYGQNLVYAITVTSRTCQTARSGAAPASALPRITRA